MRVAARRRDDRRIAVLSPYDARDPRRWSGIINAIYSALQRHSPNVKQVSGGAVEFAGGAARRLLRLLGFPGDIRFSKPFARLAGAWASVRLWAIGADAVVAVAASNYVAFLHTRKPIIYISDTTFAALARLYPEFASFPRWLRLHGTELEGRSLRRASHVIYPSEWAKQSALADYGIDPAIIHLLPFGPNLGSELLARFAAAKAADFDQSLRLLFVSVDWERKNGDLVLEIVDHLRRAGLACEIFLVGRIPQRVRESEAVHVVGFLDKTKPADVARLCQIYAAAHLLVLPTTADASPIVFSEAQAFGCPAVTYDVGGTASAVLDKETGIVLPLTATAADFAAAIADLVARPVAYEEMSRNARRRYQQCANWDAWAQLILHLAPDCS